MKITKNGTRNQSTSQIACVYVYVCLSFLLILIEFDSAVLISWLNECRIIRIPKQNEKKKNLNIDERMKILNHQQQRKLWEYYSNSFELELIDMNKVLYFSLFIYLFFFFILNLLNCSPLKSVIKCMHIFHNSIGGCTEVLRAKTGGF